MKRRICVLLPSISDEGGGVTTVARALTHALYDSGEFEIEVLAFKSKHADDQIATKFWPPVSIKTFSTFGPRSFSFSPFMVIHVMLHSYDAVHMHGIWSAHGIAAFMAQLKRIPIMISVHGMLDKWILLRSKFKKKLVGFLYQDKLLRKANILHALTNAEFLDCRRFSDTEIIVVPNFVDLPTCELAAPSWYKPIYDHKDLFLFFGRIHEKKGWHQILDAWASICEDDHDFSNSSQLIFGGWIDGTSDFFDLVSEVENKFGNIRYIGAQFDDQKFATFRSADFFLLPSVSEGMPMVVLEAASCDCILIISSHCNLPEFFPDGAIETGVSPADIKAALVKTKRMNGEQRQKMIESARKTLDDQFARHIIISKYLATLSSLVEHK